MAKVLTSVVDKNGVATRRWKNPDVPGGNSSVDARGNVLTQFIPLASTRSESDFNGVILSDTIVNLTAKDGRMVTLTIPETGALLNKLTEYPSEYGAPNHDNISVISNDILAGFRDKSFYVIDKHVGEISISADEQYLLRSNLELYMNTARDIEGWHSTHGLVDVIKSPISDREENYWIGLGPRAMITMDIFQSGLSDGDFGSNDRDQVTLYRSEENPDGLTIQIAYTDDIDLEETIDAMDDEEYEAYKDDINSALAEVDPRIVANFDSPDSVEILFNDTDEGEIDEKGNLNFTTSNVLFQYSTPEHVALMNKAWNVFRSKVDY